MVVFKTTPEGMEIKERIKAQESVPCIRRWLSRLLLARVHPDDLMEKINQEVVRAEQRGRQQKAAEIRKALGE
jgi:hypothetical protein